MASDRFYAEKRNVYRNSTQERICECEAHIEGAAEQIARALNRLPQAEALLIRAAQIVRHAEEVDNTNGITFFADEIEEWMVDGV